MGPHPIKWMACLAAAGLLWLAPAASAEFYKYVDKDGHVRFTDDINQVPAEQRQKVQSYTESDSPPPASLESETAGEAIGSLPPDDSAPAEGGEGDQGGFDYERSRKRIEAMKAELDAEYKAIVAEQEKLKAEREAAKTAEQIAEFNRRVEALNQRASAYEKRGAEYNRLVDEFNKQLLEHNRQQP